MGRRRDEESSERGRGATPPEEPGVEWLQVVDTPDLEPAGATPRLRPGRWYLLVLAGLVVLIVVGLIQHSRRTSSTADPAPSTTASSSHSASSSPPSSSRASTPTAVQVTDLHRALLDVPAGWELFARGPQVLLRIDLAHGRITRTAVPQLSSSGPVSFVAGPDRVIIRPQDSVDGYVVPDGRPASVLSPKIFGTGQILPGPDRQHVWVEADDGNAMVLSDFEGHVGNHIVVLPARGALADQRGYALFQDISGFYASGPAGVRRVTTGVVLAAGPTRFLIAECDDQHRCGTDVVDRANGARHTISSVLSYGFLPGVISPDGSMAAMFRLGDNGPELHLIDLATGADRGTNLSIDPSAIDASLIWSPDSRWVFATGKNGLAVLDRSGRIHNLGVPLPIVTQLAVRLPQ
ncbi:TolB family protein [Jatrophihabitans sp. DSM 45814]